MICASWGRLFSLETSEIFRDCLLVFNTRDFGDGDKFVCRMTHSTLLTTAWGQRVPSVAPDTRTREQGPSVTWLVQGHVAVSGARMALPREPALQSPPQQRLGPLLTEPEVFLGSSLWPAEATRTLPTVASPGGWGSDFPGRRAESSRLTLRRPCLGLWGLSPRLTGWPGSGPNTR